MKTKTINTIWLLLILLTTTVCIASPEVLRAENHQQTEVKQKFIIKLKDGVTAEQLEENGVDGRQLKILQTYNSINAVLVEFTDDIEIDNLIEDDQVETISIDRYRKWLPPTDPIIIEDDDIEIDGPSITTPSGVTRVKADDYDYTKKVNATIAIIDSGIDATHKNLNVIKGINFINPEEPQVDDDGHGTHVAGTVAAKPVKKGKNRGIVGVAPGANLIALKVFDENGSTYDSVIIAAVDWVTEHANEVDVVNMSLGGFRGWGVDLLHKAIQRSVDKGVVYVVAAGNEGRNIYFSENYMYNSVPAAYPEVMTVSAMVDTDGYSGGFGSRTPWGADDTLAEFSNYSDRQHLKNPVYSPGACIDVAAPGVEIYSTWPGNRFAKLDGTSMASPHVAGVVARYIEKNRDQLFPGGVKNAESVYQIRQILINHSEPQENWNESHDSKDPDPYHEGLIQVVE